MTVPQEYMLAQQRFDALLVELIDKLGLTTRHQVYAVLFGFLQVFRSRLDADQTLVFAGALPAIVSAMFVADWEPGEAPRPFADPAGYDEEVRNVRRDHNFAPPGARRVVAAAIRSQCDCGAFNAALAQLPREAAAFWE
ncbi:DUF2267 domain-containing protein [Hoeflea sp. YIM 152468]|uniref:DUF2267 domain-containing protein n=1 Tax=Hoeflea sp. YIM 152468 TaxID=3031759 RepID=UPI0023DBFA81|nr:DUF2267 domain-containing protein [Hoeflea sp. YIM 152468]MDF1610010.1 DUF2267 domain-containing protein [Hoeflea sp. YIM 152468]